MLRRFLQNRLVQLCQWQQLFRIYEVELEANQLSAQNATCTEREPYLRDEEQEMPIRGVDVRYGPRIRQRVSLTW